MRSIRLAALCIAAALFAPAMAMAEPTVIFITRHGEKVDDGKDPDLSAQGNARARGIANLLRKAGVRQIYSSTYKRTRQTAQPLAAATGLEVQGYDAGKPADMVQKVKALQGPTLVVGHSNTVPELVRLFGGAAVAPIADDEFDRLYQVIIGDDGKVTTVQLTSTPAI